MYSAEQGGHRIDGAVCVTVHTRDSAAFNALPCLADVALFIEQLSV